MADNLLGRAGTRVAAALLRRGRRYWRRLTAPDEFSAKVLEVKKLAERMDLEGRVIAVTGASRGVGLALATAFAQAGARVVINGRDPGRLRSAAEGVNRAGARFPVTAIQADVSSADGARCMIAETLAGHGRIDVLINNAAMAGPLGAKPWDIQPAVWSEVVAADLNGPFFCAREAMRWMVPAKAGGRIINVSSGAGRMAASGMAAYVASKFGLEGMTRALALDAEGTGVVVCAVELGSLRTDMARALVNWEEHLLLPPPETVVPVFLHALSAPPGQVHGRILASWRYEKDAEAEAALAGPLAALPKFAFPHFQHNGRPVLRTTPGLRAFDRAENPLGTPPKAREVLAAAGLDFSRYPDPEYPRLRRALADHLGLPPECFTFGSGSAELVERCVRIFAGPGEEVLSNDPTWFMFDRYCAIAEVQPRKISSTRRTPDGPFDHNLDAMARAVTARTRLVYLVNPSNPLGNGIRKDDFARFLEEIPDTLPVVVDEAYLEFSDSTDILRAHEIVNRTDRLVIGLRTFSKFYGLAGLRIGYAFGSARAMALFSRLENLFSISSVGQEAAIAALADTEHARATHELLRTEKAHIGRVLSGAGLQALPSEVHFLQVQAPVPAAQADRLWSAFVEAGVIFPRGIFCDRFMLFPVLKRADNDRHLQILLALADAGSVRSTTS
jgi:histidinol-phosphate aminotransferase